MLLLFAPASAIVPCPSASPLACRCCCRRHRRHSATKRAFAFAPFSVRDCSRWCHLLLLRHSPFGIAVANAAVAAVAIPPLCKLLPLRRSPFRIASINTAAAVNVPLPRELLLWRHSQFGIAVTPSRHHASICFCALLWSGSQSLMPLLPPQMPTMMAMSLPVGHIPPPRFKLRRRPPLPSANHWCHQAAFATVAANLVIVTLLSAAAILLCNIWSAVAAAVSCLWQTPLSSLLTLLIVALQPFVLNAS